MKKIKIRYLNGEISIFTEVLEHCFKDGELIFNTLPKKTEEEYEEQEIIIKMSEIACCQITREFKVEKKQEIKQQNFVKNMMKKKVKEIWMS